MTDPGCVRVAPLLSAFVDGQLGAADRERVAAHLLDCPLCRAEAGQLRTVRQLLSRTDPEGAPTDLSSRLVSIAGDHASQPLWTGAFRRPAPVTDAGWQLPRRRRQLRARVAKAVVATGMVLAALALAGYAAAPRQQLALPEVDLEARAALSSALGDSRPGDQALAAVSLADAAPADLAQRAGPEGLASGAVLDAATAYALLRRSAGAAGRFEFSGHQFFAAFRGNSAMSADVQVVSRAAAGLELSATSPGGVPVSQHFSPAVLGGSMDADRLDLLQRNYELSGRSGASVAGRPATVVTATRNGELAARWWLDDDTGIQLWHETYDDGLELSYGYTSIDFTPPAGAAAGHYGQRLVPSARVPRSVEELDELQAAGWQCPERLGGLSLVAVGSDRLDAPAEVQAVYSDGLSTMTVVQQRGQLAAPSTQGTWDQDLGGYVIRGAVTTATWQSGGAVFTVATDGSDELLRSAASALPQHGQGPSTMESILAGWTQIVAEIRG